MLDVDGDGLLDRVTNASTEAIDGQCRANWNRNLGPPADSSSTHPQFGPAQPLITLPRLKWHGTTVGPSPLDGAPAANPQDPHLEDCALNGQVTAFQELVLGVGCHNGTACVAGTTAPGLFCSPGGTECPGFGPPIDRTYLAYRWLDMDADGLVDLVAAVHGNINTYDIVQGNGLFNGVQRPPEPDLFGPWPACPGHAVTPTLQPQVETARTSRAAWRRWTCPLDAPAPSIGPRSRLSRAGAADGVSHATQVSVAAASPSTAKRFDRRPYMRCEGLYPWFIYKNTGNGTFASSPVIKYQPVPLESDTGDSSIIGRRGGAVPRGSRLRRRRRSRRARPPGIRRVLLARVARRWHRRVRSPALHIPDAAPAREQDQRERHDTTTGRSCPRARRDCLTSTAMGCPSTGSRVTSSATPTPIWRTTMGPSTS